MWLYFFQVYVNWVSSSLIFSLRYGILVVCVCGIALIATATARPAMDQLTFQFAPEAAEAIQTAILEAIHAPGISAASSKAAITSMDKRISKAEEWAARLERELVIERTTRTRQLDLAMERVAASARDESKSVAQGIIDNVNVAFDIMKGIDDTVGVVKSQATDMESQILRIVEKLEGLASNYDYLYHHCQAHFQDGTRHLNAGTFAETSNQVAASAISVHRCFTPAVFGIDTAAVWIACISKWMTQADAIHSQIQLVSEEYARQGLRVAALEQATSCFRQAFTFASGIIDMPGAMKMATETAKSRVRSEGMNRSAPQSARTSRAPSPTPSVDTPRRRSADGPLQHTLDSNVAS
jgi:hypothetical protein